MHPSETMGAFFCLFIKIRRQKMKNSTLLHIPHASTVIPGNYLASFRQAILPHEIEVMTDWFCDELFDCGRDRIVFPISRLVCDVERFRDDKQEIMADNKKMVEQITDMHIDIRASSQYHRRRERRNPFAVL